MKKLMLILAILLILPSAYSWRWDTHKMFVESFYNNLPDDVRENLNLSLMKIGSIVPDEVFHDNVKHHYPPSLPLADAWLDATKEEYAKGNYENASLAFGIATHYITDSFAAPHYIAKETWEHHSKFEAQVDFYVPGIKCKKQDISLKEFLERGKANAEDWDSWLKGYDKKVPEQGVDEAMEAVFAMGLKTFDTECRKQTVFEKIPFKVSAKLAIGLVIGIILIAVIILKPARKK